MFEWVAEDWHWFGLIGFLLMVMGLAKLYVSINEGIADELERASIRRGRRYPSGQIDNPYYREY